MNNELRLQVGQERKKRLIELVFDHPLAEILLSKQAVEKYKAQQAKNPSHALKKGGVHNIANSQASNAT